MFFVKDLEDRIELHPSYFNCDAPRHIRERLYEKVEGTNTGSMMIIAVIKIDEVSEPKIAPGRGVALYDISYQAVVWRPFRGEVVDGLVSSVVTNGFFVEVCGLSVFVSRAMIPMTMQYTVEGSTPNFSDSDGMTVERGSQVRLRIKGIRGEMGQMYAIGSIKEDYLGMYFIDPLDIADHMGMQWMSQDSHTSALTHSARPALARRAEARAGMNDVL